MILETLGKARTGVVDEDVEPSELRYGARDHVVDLRPLRHVGLVRERSNPVIVAKPCRFALCIVEVSLRDEDIGPRGRERACDTLSHPLRAAGNECGASLENARHAMLPSPVKDG